FDLGRCDETSTSWPSFSRSLMNPLRLDKPQSYIDELKTRAKAATPEASEADRELRTLKGAAGYFVGGTFKTKLENSNSYARKNFNLASRTLITLDADFAPTNFPAVIHNSSVSPYIGTYYTTFSHRDDRPKIRIVMPLTGPISPEKYQPIARKIAQLISPDLSWFDPVSFVEAQLMFFPVVPLDNPFWADSWGYVPVDGDEILALYENWQDPLSWPLTPKELADPRTYRVDQLNDPRQKPGLIGAFCNAYSISEVIETYLNDKYVPVEANRYTHLGGSGHAGAVAYDGDTHLYSRHTHDPANTGTCHNAFDLVRIHKFGYLDQSAAPGTPSNELPSLKAMLDFASRDPALAIMGFGKVAPDKLPDEVKDLPPDLLKAIGYNVDEQVGAKPKPLSPGQIQDDIIEVLSGRKGRCFNSDSDIQKWGSVDFFSCNYKVVAPMTEGSNPIIIRLGDSCKLAEPEEVVLELMDWLRVAVERDKRFLPYFKDSKDLIRYVKLWTHKQADLEELPKPVAFRSDPELTMNRLSYDPLPCDDVQLPSVAPTFHSMLKRISTNRLALVQRLGSIFDMKANRKQAVWLYGPGDAGKSTIQWLISQMTGPKPVCTLSQELIKSAFFTQNLVGRRVALVPEAGAWFIRQDRFKSLTGDRIHGVNPKGKPSYSANIDTMFFFFSNDKPEIANSKEFLSRVIDCKIDSIPEDEILGEFEVQQRLTSEMAYIIGYCVAAYNRVNLGRSIPVEQATLKEIAEDFQSSEYEFVERYLKPGDPDDYNEHEHVTPNQLCRMYAEWLGTGRNGAKERDLKTFLRRDYKAFIKKLGFMSGKRYRVWCGVLWRDPTELMALDPPPVSPAQVKSSLILVPPENRQ
ncbi:MAG: DUF5906 domain-containing protein, partial [Candidatus Pacearchaeota archaeon]|nr:DUF5906 domain-containing protein [Candidatus Pacearchaeota archaeon]